MKGSNNGIRTIGLILEDAFTDFAIDIIHSVSFMVKDLKDIRLVIIPGRQDDSRDPNDLMHQYKIRHNLIYMMNEKYRFDGLLLTFPNLSRMQTDIYENIPKVYLATELKDEVTVNYDDGMGIREAIDYLVKIRGVTKLCMLGGRSDNIDAQKRKRFFRECLEENGLSYTEDQYEPADMSTQTQEAAARLLARNPETQAVFCVNDASASGLYDVLSERGMEPGKDVYVFGFDNGPLAVNLNPPLASIGANGMTLGQKALEMLLEQMDGKEVRSQKIPTRLFGRESLMYDMYEFTAREMLTADNLFINRVFNNCFYRYRNEIISQRSINLERLFFEILSRMLKSLKNRVMNTEEFSEISRMIGILFDRGVMMYTDPNRFVYDLGRIQATVNESMRPSHVTTMNNRLFTLMRDKAIQSQGVRTRTVTGRYSTGRNRIQDFMIWTTNYGKPGEEALEFLIRQMDKIGLQNAAMYLYREPIIYTGSDGEQLPDTMRLRCVIRDGELFMIPADRKECPVAEIYDRDELPVEKLGYVSYPLFYGKYLFGMLVCGADEKLFEIGEFLTLQLSRAICMNWVSIS
uniref:Periplasmic-binding protein/LacI transcriptional regulator n=1 Tax=uncultured bacterium Contigcl_23 TaxID=1393667 RepID=W0FQ32_9BACT|nr:periplasmic-binding protein/LacI transcriptional regulator [uncultured bacterium Contigcl_23]